LQGVVTLLVLAGTGEKNIIVNQSDIGNIASILSYVVDRLKAKMDTLDTASVSKTDKEETGHASGEG